MYPKNKREQQNCTSTKSLNSKKTGALVKESLADSDSCEQNFYLQCAKHNSRRKQDQPGTTWHVWALRGLRDSCSCQGLQPGYHLRVCVCVCVRACKRKTCWTGNFIYPHHKYFSSPSQHFNRYSDSVQKDITDEKLQVFFYYEIVSSEETTPPTASKLYACTKRLEMTTIRQAARTRAAECQAYWWQNIRHK